MDLINKALKICKKDLRLNYGKNGIYAGYNQYKEYWARDSFLSSLGVTRIKDFDIAKKNLALFLNFQKENGHLPSNITESDNLTSFWNQASDFITLVRRLTKPMSAKKSKNFNIRYRSPYPFSDDIQDSTLLCIIAFNDYFSQSKDHEFLNQNFKKLVKAIEWSIGNLQDGLIKEGILANWQDNILQTGFMLYTNVCFYKALKDMSQLSKEMKDDYLYNRYSKLSKRVKERVNEIFWNGEFYSRRFNKKRDNKFTTHGNNLAIIWGIADMEKSTKIQKFISKFNLDNIPIKDSNEKVMSFYSTAIHSNLFGTYKYHLHSWPWIGCIDAISKNKVGFKKEARDELRGIAKLIVKEGVTHEIFDQDGKPLKTWFYTSEHPFSLEAGLFIYACDQLKKK
jgi:glycogen debranching enzyme